MRKKLVSIVATILAVLLLASTAAVVIPLALETEPPVFETTIPTHLIDFTTETIQESFTHTDHMTVSMGNGFTVFTATAGDPQTWLEAPACRPNQAQYMAVSYRTEAKVKGEFFCTRTDNNVMGTPGTNQQWDWNATGEWEILVASMDAWKNAADSIGFEVFRFDPLEGGNVKAGDSIDVEYIAFFATKEDAEGFDFSEYMDKLAWEEAQDKLEQEKPVPGGEWADPVYKEMETTAADSYEGTLEYTISEDGQTVTISYEINGETLSYTVPNNNNYLFGGYAGTDDLNRPLYDSDEVGSYKADERYIGLFYFLWHGEHGDSGIFDLQKIIDEEGLQAAGSLDCGRYGPQNSMHWFAEPLYGYYYANDEWVIRKHAELLTLANVDFLFLDVTNGYTYLPNVLKLMKVLHELNEQGFDAPQIVFYTNTDAHRVVRELYNSIYKKETYPDTWFYLDGKPVIVAPYDANIDDFFTIQQNQWPNDPEYKENGWPWMDFQWPQRVFTDENGAPNAINVSVAQHSGTVCFSQSSLYGNFQNRGRSFAHSDPDYWKSLRGDYLAWQADQSLTNYGLNFQAQWDYALSTDAPIILVTGWNEWVAQRQGPAGSTEVVFIDTASMEFSRDTEMMRGGYFDNYYMQLIYNIQRAKGTAPVVVQDGRKPINVTGEFDQWDDVLVTYVDATGDTADRNATGFGNTSYKNTSGRNDIESAKVTADTKNLYFYVKTVNDITMYNSESSWMELYVNVDGRDAENGETGWNGYDFLINYYVKDAFTTTVGEYVGTDGEHEFAAVGDVSYRVKGNEMMIAVPLSMLGIEDYRAIDLEFKWADSETIYDEMEDFYCDGDVAPLGRLNYVFQNYIPGVNDPILEDTTPEDESDTRLDGDETTDCLLEDTSSDETDDPKSGCKSVLSVALIPTVIALGGVVLVCRKRKDE